MATDTAKKVFGALVKNINAFFTAWALKPESSATEETWSAIEFNCVENATLGKLEE